MITQLEVTNSQGGVLHLPLYDVSNGFVVEGVEGLDPVKATIVSSGFAQIDGTQYQSSRREDRNIKIKIGLEADFVDNTVSDLRSQLYRFFMPKSRVSIRFYDDKDEGFDISGRVETCEAPLFTDEPAMDVSIICFDPDFYDTDVAVVSASTTADTMTIPVDYEGTVESGLTFVLNVDRAITGFSIYNTTPDGNSQQLDFSKSDLVAGDVVTISTVPGSKYVRVMHSGVEASALYGMTPQSRWINLAPGVNQIRVYVPGAGIPYTITYTNKYGGL